MNILLLAGTSEARRLAKALSDQDHQVTASLAGATRAPLDMGCETRVGGFGGDAGFRAWLDAHPVDLVVDATHPFAHRVTARSVAICEEAGVPILQVNRPGWTTEGGDLWTFIDHPEQAAAHIEPGARVFLATGRQTLHDFANLSESHLFCRQIDPPDGPFPFPNGEYVVGRPPFSIEEEIGLFQKLGIDVLVVKNAGGAMSRSKLDAARALSMPVLMINRPKRPDGPIVDSVADALDWVAAHAHH